MEAFPGKFHGCLLQKLFGNFACLSLRIDSVVPLTIPLIFFLGNLSAISLGKYRFPIILPKLLPRIYSGVLSRIAPAAVCQELRKKFHQKLQEIFFETIIFVKILKKCLPEIFSEVSLSIFLSSSGNPFFFKEPFQAYIHTQEFFR